MTQSTHTLELSPADLKLEVASGTQLQDVLFAQGVEFPCGGRGRCKGCRVKVLKGILPVGEEEKNLLTGAELAGGWRLACRHSIAGDLKLELAQWEMPILSDQSTFKFAPREGLGAAIDLGTTTIAAQLLDLQTGGVLAVVTAATS
jgi:ferredoxin